jgi:phosphoserine phosphatase
MSKPTVFLSSTYVDLSQTRGLVARFIDSYGLEPIMFEDGGIYFDWKKPIDVSCFDAVKQSSMYILIIGGRYGSPTSDDKEKGIKKYTSVTAKEYETAKIEQIPIFIFIKQEVLIEFQTYADNKTNEHIKYAQVDSVLIYEFIDKIFNETQSRFVFRYSEADDIIDGLRSQFAGMLRQYIDNSKSIASNSLSSSTDCHVNGYKVFYNRHVRGLSQLALSSLTSLSIDRIKELEDCGLNNGYIKSVNYGELVILENTFGSGGGLEAKPEEATSLDLIKYYNQKKSVEEATTFLKNGPPEIPITTKVVFIEFDGTLIKNDNNYSVWQQIWTRLGYSVSECSIHHQRFLKKLISHQQWCDITLEAFNKKGLSKDIVQEVADEIKLVPLVDAFFNKLHDNNIPIYILSGSIEQVIKHCLKDFWSLFEEVKANKFIFNGNEVSGIKGTKYDFENKPIYIKRVLEELGISPTEALFIGNSCNDVYASRSGIRTLCINPRLADGGNVGYWTHCLYHMEKATEMLDYISFS